MEKIKISKAADILFYSRANIKRIKELPKDCTPRSSQEAYDIQDELTKRYLSEYKKTFVIGKKIGCTNEAAKIQLNIKDSFYGNIISDNISKSNATIDPKKYFGPFVEPEFSFVMKDELDFKKAPYSPETVYKSVLAVLPSIEIVDSRYEDWTSIGVNNLIADNAVHAHWIYGEEKKELNLFNFNNHSVDLFIKLGINISKKKIIIVKSTNHFYKSFKPHVSEIIYASIDGIYPNNPKKINTLN